MAAMAAIRAQTAKRQLVAAAVVAATGRVVKLE
jgi:hypothetical protein